MRRRLDIAASIVVTPQLMFLDEPTTGLDPRSRNQVWDIIRALVAEGTTILLCTQYLDEADQLADRIAVIDHGKVIAEGTPAELKASVGSGALHVRLARSRAAPDGRARARGRARRRRRCETDPTALTAPCADADRAAEAVAGAGPRRRRIAGFSLGQPSLDEVFLALTGHPARGAGRRRATRSRRHEHDDEPRPPATGGADEAAVRKASGLDRAPAARERAHAALAFGWRGMLKVKHVPEQLLDVTITPMMFVVMFTYLFGGAIAGSTGEYLDYILPGILVMSVLFTTVYSGVALNTDLTKGVMDRFRSLPIWRPAPLVGALLGDSVRYVLAGTVIIVARRDPRLPARCGDRRRRAALALVVLFAFGLSWVFTTLGLVLRSPNAVMNAGFMGIFPLTFLSATSSSSPRRCRPAWRRSSTSTRSRSWRPASRGLMDGNAEAATSRRARHRRRADRDLRAADDAAVPGALTRQAWRVRCQAHRTRRSHVAPAGRIARPRM